MAKTYPVDGICDDYQKMLIEYLGNNISPVPVPADP